MIYNHETLFRFFSRRIGLALLAPIALMGCGDAVNRTDVARSGATVTSVGEAQIGGPFTLVDDKGDVVTEADLIGQPSLIYFGFTYCPDVCPTALSKMGRAEDLMGAAAQEVQFILVSVDPERDTPEQLAVYVTNNGFPQRLRGFTGTPEQIEGIKSAYKVYAQKVPLEDSAADYTMDHQDMILMMGRDGKFVDLFPNRSTPQEIAGRVRAYLAAG
jgi:protein SCO1/2